MHLACHNPTHSHDYVHFMWFCVWLSHSKSHTKPPRNKKLGWIYCKTTTSKTPRANQRQERTSASPSRLCFHKQSFICKQQCHDCAFFCASRFLTDSYIQLNKSKFLIYCALWHDIFSMTHQVLQVQIKRTVCGLHFCAVGNGFTKHVFPCRMESGSEVRLIYQQ